MHLLIRFKTWQLMIGVALAAVATLVVGSLSEACWVGNASIPLQFMILDSLTGEPLKGASIRLVDNTPEYEAVTGADGQARLVIRATTAGRSTLIRSTRAVNYDWALIVTAEGHRRLVANLRQFTLAPVYHSSPAPPPVVIRLEPTILNEAKGDQ